MLMEIQYEEEILKDLNAVETATSVVAADDAVVVNADVVTES